MVESFCEQNQNLTSCRRTSSRPINRCMRSQQLSISAGSGCAVSPKAITGDNQQDTAAL